MTIPAKRGPHGHYLPGVSGNPGGRTSALTEVRELLRPNAALFVERLVELARSPDPTIALPAVREALDRLVGKPIVAVEQEITTLNMGQLYLEALKSVNQPKTIEGTAIEDEPARTHLVRGVVTPITGDTE
jgi:hypothetical protein